MLLTQMSPSLPRNLALRTFGKLLIVCSKVNRLYLLYLMAQRCCLLHLIKQNCLLKTFPSTLNLIIHISLYLFFPSRIDLKWHNISLTHKMIKKVIKNLDSSKLSGPDCILVMVLKNCEPKLSYTLAELFNMCLKESSFPDCWKVLSVAETYPGLF